MRGWFVHAFALVSKESEVDYLMEITNASLGKAEPRVCLHTSRAVE
jgi:hypothetical protein